MPPRRAEDRSPLARVPHRGRRSVRWIALLLVAAIALGSSCACLSAAGVHPDPVASTDSTPAAEAEAAAASCAQAQLLTVSGMLGPMMGLFAGGGVGVSGGDGGVGGELSALQRAAQAASLCPSGIDFALRHAGLLLDAQQSERAAAELQRVLALVAAGGHTSSSEVDKRSKHLDAVLQLWRRIETLRSESAASSSAAASTTSACSIIDALGSDSACSQTQSPLPLIPYRLETLPLPEKLDSSDSLPPNLRLLWPTPFFALQAQDIVPAGVLEPLLEAMMQMRRDAEAQPRGGRSRGGGKRGFASKEDVFSASRSSSNEPCVSHMDDATPCSSTPPSPIRRACTGSSSGVLGQFCHSLASRLHSLFRREQPFRAPHRAGRDPLVVDVELLGGGVHVEEYMEAPFPFAGGEDMLANIAASTTPPPPSPSASEAGGSNCSTFEWDPPQFFTAWFILQRQAGTPDSQRGLSIDDELSFPDPRPQAAPLAPRHFLATDEPLRVKLNEGDLIVASSALSRSMAPNTGSEKARVWVKWNLAVRYGRRSRNTAARCEVPGVRSQDRANSADSIPASSDPGVARPRLASPALFYRWPTPVYRSQLFDSSSAEAPELLSALRGELLAMRASAPASLVKSNRGGWHSHVQLLGSGSGSGARPSKPASRSAGSTPPSTPSALLQAVRSRIVQHVHSYMRSMAHVSCLPLLLHPTDPSCRPFDYRSMESDLAGHVDIVQSWAIINEAGQFHMPHSHPGAMLSGVVYVATGGGGGGGGGGGDQPTAARSGGARGDDASTLHFRAPGPLAVLHGTGAVPREWTDPFAAPDSSDGDAHTHHSQLPGGMDVSEPLQVGKIVLFPAWLEHYVVPHWPGAGGDASETEGGSDEPVASNPDPDAHARIAISFNVVLR